MGMEFIFGLTVGGFKETGKIIICMDKEFTLGKMAGDMKVNMRTIGNMGTVFILGMTGNSTKENGL